MIILHTADWHLGHLLYDFPREEEQRAFLEQITEIVRQRQPDAFILAGDVFNTDNPPVECTRMFTEAVLAMRDAAPNMCIIITAGNHDSYRRLEANNALWQRHGVHIVGFIARSPEGFACLDKHIIEVRGKDGLLKGYVLAVPHAFPQNFPLTDDTPCDKEQRPARFFSQLLKKAEEINSGNLPIVLSAHLAVSGSDLTGHDGFVGFQDSFGCEVLSEGYDYAALGHIHRPQTVDKERIRYSGTPIAVSFDEAYAHSVSLVKIEKHGSLPEIETVEIQNPHPLVSLPEKSFLPVDEALQLLEEYPSDKQDYIRLNILPPDTSMADVNIRAAQICKEKACRFCTVNIKKGTAGQNGVSKPEFSVEELKRISPVEVAMHHYKEKTGEQMPEEQQRDLEDLFQGLMAGQQLQNNGN